MKSILLTAVLSGTLVLATSVAPAADSKVINVKVTGAGKPVIFIPGLACSGAVWDDTVKHLQDKYECHVVSIAGFGGTPPVPTANLLDSARDEIIAYVRTQKLDKPAIVGHSLGGTVAMAIGEAAPELLGRIISVDGLPFLAGVVSPGVTDVAGAEKAAAAMRERMGKQTPEQFAAAQRNFVVPSMVTRPDDIQRIADMCAKSDPATVSDAMTQLMVRDFRPQLGTIKCPIAVFGALAQLLQYAPREALEQNYKAQFANAPQTSFQFFDKAKHFIMIDEPAAFMTALEEKLAAK